MVLFNTNLTSNNIEIDGEKYHGDLKLKKVVGDIRMTDTPVAVTKSSAVAIFNNEVYLITSNSFYKFNGKTWTRVSSAPITTVTLVVFENELHAMCSNGSTHYKFNGETWSSVATMSSNNVTSAVVFKNEIYTLGRIYSNTEYTNAQKYNGSSWSSLTAPPIYANNAVVYKDKIYIMATTGTDIYSSSNGTTWTKVATAPYTDIQKMVATDDGIHLLGSSKREFGYHAGSDYPPYYDYPNTYSHYKFNGTTWTKLSSLPYKTYQANAVSDKNDIYMLGGNFPYYTYERSDGYELYDNKKNFYKINTTVYEMVA
jgi:hypothetical protein